LGHWAWCAFFRADSFLRFFFRSCFSLQDPFLFEVFAWDGNDTWCFEGFLMRFLFLLALHWLIVSFPFSTNNAICDSLFSCSMQPFELSPYLNQ